LTAVLLLAAILFLAILPNVLPYFFSIPDDHAVGSKPVEPPPSPFKVAAKLVLNYFKEVANGDSFVYYDHLDFRRQYPRSFLEDAGPALWFSVVNVCGAGVLALVFGTVFGLRLARSGGWLKECFGFLALVPDFAAALLLQMLVAFIYQQTGVSVANVASVNDDVAILLPFLTLAYIPLVNVVRMVSQETYQILTEDYIRTAKAKGLKRLHIYLDHVLRNVLPSLKADLPRLCAMMVGSLFVVEYLFNQPGIVYFLHVLGFDQSYSMRVNTLLGLMLVYAVLYFCMRGVIFAWERGFARD
jgi:peptide/nickel transport system permease protein